MRKREERRKLELRRERLRALATLSDDQAREAAGGIGWDYEGLNLPNGRVGSRCCA